MEFIFENQNFDEKDVNNMPSTSLAFVGDAFFTLYARTKVLNTHAKSGKFHKKTIELVNAHSQSDFLAKLKGLLTEPEEDIVRRARNTYTASRSKNAKISDYKRSTAFEALLGYLFLTRQYERLHEILKITCGEVIL